MSILSDEEIGDCVDDYFGLMALQHKYIYDIDQVQEYGLKLARAIEAKVLQHVAMDNLVAWQQEFDNSAQLIGNKPTSYAKLKEDFE